MNYLSIASRIQNCFSLTFDRNSSIDAILPSSNCGVSTVRFFCSRKNIPLRAQVGRQSIGELKM
ncbi:hypothetical protein [Microcoleus sp. bin38.metabat.b11b12b14.051]|uniref:hypothetical protein n=1 Tax=Microcoleus sp. bin38.metabat.b11b12b14.051 TaxID=2742709 RepID=UPI0025D18198|nr:hypothetical protein [Microcoleus sp. bin38.metabat.b11b12b14.051]